MCLQGRTLVNINQRMIDIRSQDGVDVDYPDGEVQNDSIVACVRKSSPGTGDVV